jgi:hypothetical protein
VTPEDAAATTTLLRAPAAIAAGAFLVGLTAGEAASWSHRAPDSWALAALRIAIVFLVCLPFLLPSEWYRSRGLGMPAWITIAALAASVRGAYLCALLYPLQSLGAWLTFAGLELAIGATLWVAVFALRRRPSNPQALIRDQGF